MNRQLGHDLNGLDKLLRSALEEGLAYLKNINEQPTSVRFEDFGKVNKNLNGEGGDLTLEEFKSRFRHLMVASTGPRYWGFVTGGSTPAALMGDVLASIYDQNTQTSKGHGDVSAIVEFEAVRLLLDLFDLPHDYLGGMVTGATMSNFTCLAVARQWMGNQSGVDIAKNGVQGSLKILSATPHSSSIKALSMLGLGSNNLVQVKTIDETREAIDIGHLEKTINDLNGKPFILISSGGTVNSVDFDDFKSIKQLKKKYKFWWHIDAAFGGFASVSPLHSHLIAGWEDADSITVDGHKWLNVPYENAFFFVKEKHKYLQVETFQNSNAPYLGDPLENFNYLNFLPENSRRFKALPVWFTLKAYGKEGYREVIERNIECARLLGTFIRESDSFELLAPVRLNTVCFSLKNESDPEKVHTFLNILNNGARVFMTSTTYRGRMGIRAALVNWRTSEKDVLTVKQEMKKAYKQFAKQYSEPYPH